MCRRNIVDFGTIKIHSMSTLSLVPLASCNLLPFFGFFFTSLSFSLRIDPLCFQARCHKRRLTMVLGVVFGYFTLYYCIIFVFDNLYIVDLVVVDLF